MTGRARHASTVVVATLAIVSLLLLVGPMTGRWRLVPVLSGSMDPTLRAGDLALVVPGNVADLKVGDVILYRIPIGDRHLEIHRVVELQRSDDGPIVVTKGDANDSPDPWTARLQGSTAWRLSSRIPALGAVVSYLRSPAALSVCVLIGALLAGGLGLWRIWGPARVGNSYGFDGTRDGRIHDCP
jgi:signal peptidase I